MITLSSLRVHGRYVWVVAILFGIGARCLGCFTELWFDEVLSISLSHGMGQLSDVLLTIHHDNNHPLNTMWLWFLGSDRSELTYRVPALLCGLGSIVVTFLVGRLRSIRTGYLAASLFSCSLLFVIYSSEARGYAPLLLCSLIALYALERFVGGGGQWWVITFVLATCLGLLAHSTSVNFYGALMVYSYMLLRKHSRSREVLIGLHAIPLVFAVYLYLVFIRYLPPPSGPQVPWLEIFTQGVSLLVGGPSRHFYPTVCSAVALATLTLILFAWLWSYRLHRERSYFYLCAIFLFPALSLLLSSPPVLFERYFLTSFLAIVLLFSEALPALLPCYWMVITAAILLGNAVQIGFFLKVGRNHYTEALIAIKNSDQQRPILIGSDSELRNRDLINYYATRAGIQNNEIVYVPRERWNKQPPRWIISHHLDPRFDPPLKYQLPLGPTYDLVSSFSGHYLSGWRLFLYERQ